MFPADKQLYRGIEPRGTQVHVALGHQELAIRRVPELPALAPHIARCDENLWRRMWTPSRTFARLDARLTRACVLTLDCELSFATWFIAVGFGLFRMRGSAGSPRAGAVVPVVLCDHVAAARLCASFRPLEQGGENLPSRHEPSALQFESKMLAISSRDRTIDDVLPELRPDAIVRDAFERLLAKIETGLVELAGSWFTTRRSQALVTELTLFRGR